MSKKQRIGIQILVNPSRLGEIRAYVKDSTDKELLRSKYRIVGCRESYCITEEKPLQLRLEEVLLALQNGIVRIELEDDDERDDQSKFQVEGEEEHKVFQWQRFYQLIIQAFHQTKQDVPSLLVDERINASPMDFYHDFLSLLSSKERLRVIVFIDLWQKEKGKYFVTGGAKFGADFLLYQEDPWKSHAIAMICLKSDEEECFSPLEIVSHARIAKMIKKKLIFASQTKENRKNIVYISFNHELLV